jgi:hypothetical protein
MENGTGFNGHTIANGGGLLLGGAVDDHAVLQVAFFPDMDPIDIPTNHHVVPDRGVSADGDITDNGAGWREENTWVHSGLVSHKVLNSASAIQLLSVAEITLKEATHIFQDLTGFAEHESQPVLEGIGLGADFVHPH